MMMTTKTMLFLLFFCVSNTTTHAMNPMQHIVDNLHENSKKQPKAPTYLYNYKQDPLRIKKRKKTISLRKEREWKNNLYSPHGK